ncbi:MAG TPA: branched-chain amino acid ABC transporter permease [bacterium]|nr:branched-chain amino acid ABC transporter permease [bacterium]
MTRGRVLAGLAVALAAVPFVPARIPGIFPAPLNAPGTLQLLALCLVFGAVALSYDLLFGYTGLLSFGHALFFSAGAYAVTIALSRWQWPLVPALALAAAVGLVLPLALGAVALRVRGIAFAMVTLAFAQAGSILVYSNPGGLTGGEEGLGLVVDRLPAQLIGVANTRYLYWIALAYLIVACLAAWGAVASRPGRIWPAIRENELRVEVLGAHTYPFKLLSFVVGCGLAAIGGVVYVLLVGGASPSITTAALSLALLVMVVLGGAGSLWGAVLGGALYEYLDFRLVALAGSSGIHALPAWLSVPLGEPLFILGIFFILLVLFFPGGIAAVPGRYRMARAAAPDGRRVPGASSAP